MTAKSALVHTLTGIETFFSALCAALGNVQPYSLLVERCLRSLMLEKANKPKIMGFSTSNSELKTAGRVIESLCFIDLFPLASRFRRRYFLHSMEGKMIPSIAPKPRFSAQCLRPSGPHKRPPVGRMQGMYWHEHIAVGSAVGVPKERR